MHIELTDKTNPVLPDLDRELDFPPAKDDEQSLSKPLLIPQKPILNYLQYLSVLLTKEVNELAPVTSTMVVNNVYSISMTVFLSIQGGNFRRNIQNSKGEIIAQAVLINGELIIKGCDPKIGLKINLNHSFPFWIKKLVIIHPEGRIINNSDIKISAVEIYAKRYVETRKNKIHCDIFNIDGNQIDLRGSLQSLTSVYVHADNKLVLSKFSTIDSPQILLEGKSLKYETQLLTSDYLNFIAQEFILGSEDENTIDLIVKHKIAIIANSVRFLNTHAQTKNLSIQSQQSNFSPQAKMFIGKDLQCFSANTTLDGRLYVGNNIIVHAENDIECQQSFTCDVMNDAQFKAGNRTVVQGNIVVWHDVIVQSERAIQTQNLQLSCEGNVSFLSQQIIEAMPVEISANNYNLQASDAYHQVNGCKTDVRESMVIETNMAFIDGNNKAKKLLLKSKERVFIDINAVISVEDQLAFETDKVTCYGKIKAINLIYMCVNGNASFYFDCQLDANLINIECNSMYTMAQLIKAGIVNVKANKHFIIGCAPHDKPEFIKEMLAFNRRPRIEADSVNIVASAFINLSSSLKCRNKSIACLAAIQFWSISQSKTSVSNALVDLNMSVDLPNFQVVYSDIQKFITLDNDYYRDEIFTTDTLVSCFNALITVLKILLPKVGLAISAVWGLTQLCLSLPNSYRQARALLKTPQEIQMRDLIPFIVGIKSMVVQGVSLAGINQSLITSIKVDGFQMAETALRFNRQTALSLANSAFSMVGSSRQADAVIQVRGPSLGVAATSSSRSLVDFTADVEVGQRVAHTAVYGRYHNRVIADTYSLDGVKTHIATHGRMNNFILNATHTLQSGSSSLTTQRSTIEGTTFDQQGQLHMAAGFVELQSHTVGENATFSQGAGSYSVNYTDNANHLEIAQSNVKIHQLQNKEKGTVALEESVVIAHATDNQGNIEVVQSSVTMDTFINRNGQVSLSEKSELNVTSYQDTQAASLSLQKSLLRVDDSTAINAHITAQNSQIESKNTLDLTRNATLDVHDTVVIKAKDVHSAAAVTLEENSYLKLEVEEQLIDDAQYHEQGHATIGYVADTATLHGIGAVSLVKGEIHHLNEALDFISGHGASGALQVTEMLSVTMDDALDITDQLSRATATVAVAARGITLSQTQQLNNELILESTQQNVQLNADLTARKIAIQSAQDINNDHHRVYATETTHILAQGDIHNAGGYIGSNLETITHANGSIYNQAGVIASNNYTQVTAKGNIYNSVLAEPYRGSYDIQMHYTPGRILGGAGTGHENVGVFIQCDGHFYNLASQVAAQGNMWISATQGIDIGCETNTYMSYKHTHHSGAFGHKKKTTTEYQTDIAKSSFVAGGKIMMFSDEGEITSYGADFQGADDTTMIVKKDIKIFDVIGTREKKTSSRSFGGLNHSKSHAMHKFSEATRIACPTNVLMYSKEGNVNLRGVQVFGKGHLDIKAQNIYITNPVLKHHLSFKSQHVTASLLGQNLLSKADWQMPVDPTWSKWSALEHSGNYLEAGLNAFNLGASALELSNTVMDGVRNSDLISAVVNRYLPAPQLKFGLERNKTTVDYETLGSGGIDVGSATFDAEHEIVFEGAPIHTDNDLKILAEKLSQRGVKLANSVVSKTRGVDIGVSITGDVTAGIHRSNEAMSGHSYGNQGMSCGGTLQVRVKEWDIKAGNTQTQRLDAIVDKLRIESMTDDSKVSSNSFSGNTLVDLSFAQSQGSSQLVSRISGIHANEGITNENLQVRAFTTIGGEVTSDGQVDFHPETTVAVPVTEYIHQHGHSFSGNPQAALANSEGKAAVASIGFFGRKYHGRIEPTVRGELSTNFNSVHLSAHINTAGDARHVVEDSRYNYMLDVPQTSLIDKFTDNGHYFLDAPPVVKQDRVLPTFDINSQVELNTDNEWVVDLKEDDVEAITSVVKVTKEKSVDLVSESQNPDVILFDVDAVDNRVFEPSLPGYAHDKAEDDSSIVPCLELAKLIYNVKSEKFMEMVHAESLLVKGSVSSKIIGFNLLINMILCGKDDFGEQISFASINLLSEGIISGISKTLMGNPYLGFVLFGVDQFDDFNIQHDMDGFNTNLMMQWYSIANNPNLNFLVRSAALDMAEDNLLELGRIQAIHAVAEANHWLYKKVETGLTSGWALAKYTWSNKERLFEHMHEMPLSVSGFPVHRN